VLLIFSQKGQRSISQGVIENSNQWEASSLTWLPYLFKFCSFPFYVCFSRTCI